MFSKASLSLVSLWVLMAFAELNAVSALPYGEELAPRADSSSNTSKTVIAGFLPKKWPAIIALVCYGATAAFHWIHFFRIGQRYMLTLTIGMICMIVGFVLRLLYTSNPASVTLYAIMTLFILLSPCAFLATDYMLLHRLADSLGRKVADECLILPSHIITKVFVWSDVLTFLVQSAGGGLTTSQSASSRNLGERVSMAGLILQLVSFALFTAILLAFALRVRTRYPEVWRVNSRGQATSSVFGLLKTTDVYDWKILFYTMCLTCIAILIRCAFRIAEFGGGYTGYLATHEGYFYLLDALPLWLGMTLYAFLWPTRFISRNPDIGMQTTNAGVDFQFLPTDGVNGGKNVDVRSRGY